MGSGTTAATGSTEVSSKDGFMASLDNGLNVDNNRTNAMHHPLCIEVKEIKFGVDVAEGQMLQGVINKIGPKGAKAGDGS